MGHTPKTHTRQCSQLTLGSVLRDCSWHVQGTIRVPRIEPKQGYKGCKGTKEAPYLLEHLWPSLSPQF